MNQWINEWDQNLQKMRMKSFKIKDKHKMIDIFLKKSENLFTFSSVCYYIITA